MYFLNHLMRFRQIVPTLIEITGGSHPRADPEVVSKYVGDYKRAIIFLIDALGKRQMEYFRRPKIGNIYDIKTVVPSLTPTALLSFVYGMEPAEHGIIGGVIRATGVKGLLRTIEGSVLGARSSIPLDYVGVDMKAFMIKRPPEFEGTFKVAVDVLMKYGLSSFFSEYTTATHGMLSSVRDVPEQGVMKLYYRSYDATAHDFGPYSRQAQLDSRLAAMRMRSIAMSLPERMRKDTLFVILGDHGQDDIVIDGLNMPELRPYIGVAGKVYYVYDQSAMDALEEKLPKEHYEIYEADEFRKFLGESETDERELRYRMGDRVIVAKDGHMMRLSENVPKLKGMHGGLTDEEMDVRVMFLDRDELMELTDEVVL